MFLVSGLLLVMVASTRIVLMLTSLLVVVVLWQIGIVGMRGYWW
jgi:hypothetical protein